MPEHGGLPSPVVVALGSGAVSGGSQHLSGLECKLSLVQTLTNPSLRHPHPSRLLFVHLRPEYIGLDDVKDRINFNHLMFGLNSLKRLFKNNDPEQEIGLIVVEKNTYL